MTPPAESLIKYENPVLVSSTEERVSSSKMIPQQPESSSSPVPQPLKPKTASEVASELRTEEVLNTILPPRSWMEGNKKWLQHVSNAPSTRAEVIHLEELLGAKLWQKQARETGICPERRELYSQCFDELIRQETINCAERGLLLLRLRDEIQMMMAAFQILYESSVAFGIRKAQRAEENRTDMEKRIYDLENERRHLRRQLREKKAERDATEKRELEKAEMEELKHNEEIQFVRRTQHHLQTQLEAMESLKKLNPR